MKDFIELRRIFAIVTRRLWLIVLLTAVATSIGVFVSRSQTPIYQATTTMLVGQFIQSTSVNRADIQTSADVAKTYADIALRQPVLDKVIETLKLDVTARGLKNQVRVKAIEGTQLIEVTAEATSSEAARSIADEVAAQLIALSPTTVDRTVSGINYAFIQQQLESLKQRLIDAQSRLEEIDAAIEVSTSKTELTQLQDERTALEQSIADQERNYVSLSNLLTQERASNNYLAVIEPAQSTRDPVRPRIILDTVIAGALGLLLALGLVFLFDYLDSSVHSSEQYEEFLGLAPLAVIGNSSRSGKQTFARFRRGKRGETGSAGKAGVGANEGARRLVTLERPGSAESESFRTLRTNIQFASVAKPLRSLVVTSAVPMEGKSFVAANLAVVMAQIGKRVILVDGDLRRPSVHTLFGLPNDSGFANLILSGNMSGAVHKIPEVPTLRVITSGPMPVNPSELLNSEPVRRAMAYFAEHADLVIYDAPPVGVVTDPAILAASVDGVVLVARAGATRRHLIMNAKQALQNVGVSVILPVLNGVVPRQMNTHQGQYSGYHTGRAAPTGVSNNGNGTHSDQDSLNMSNFRSKLQVSTVDQLDAVNDGLEETLAGELAG